MPSSFPRQGCCAQNQSHRIFRRFACNKLFTPNECCNKCLSPFNEVYFNGYLVSAHYYECKKCETKICFNCALSANKSDRKWNDVRWLSSPTQQSYIRLPKINEKWIKLNNALDNMTNGDLKKTMKKVIKLLGGMKNTLFFITKNLSHSQLDNVYDLLTEQQSVNNKSESKLASMPNELFSHISSFLNKSDIKTFKMCSRKISLQCLQEMKKVFINLMHGNEILLCNDVKPHEFYHFMREKRYNPKKLMSSIHAEWREEINIPSEHQIIFKTAKHSLDFEILTNEECLQNCVKTAKQRFFRRGWGQLWQKTLILDSRKVILLNEGLTVLPFDREYVMKNWLGRWNLSRYKLIFLQYFDIGKQKLRVVQYVLWEKCNFIMDDVSAPIDFLEYITDNFYAIDGVDNEWHHELMDVANQMGDNEDEPKLILYQGSELADAHWRHSTRFTVQLNDKHPWFIENKSKFVKQNDATNFPDFAKRFKTYRVSFEDKEILALCLQKYFDQRLDENEQSAFQPSLNVIFDFVNAEFVEIKLFNIPQNEHNLALKEKIVQKLDNIIGIDQIHVIMGRKVQSNDVKCCIVLSQLLEPKHCLSVYKIQIFAPRDCPNPYQIGEKGTKTVMFEYYKNCTNSDQLIDDFFETMYNATDHIYYAYYKELIDIYYKNEMEKNENIKCILTKCGGSRQTMRCMKNCEMRNPSHSPMNLNLYLTNPSKKSSLNITELEIKFVQSIVGSNQSNVGDWDFVGFPMTIWINEWDTVQTVIDLHLKKNKRHIIKAYRIKANDSGGGKSILIQKHKWENYRIVKNMKLPQDYIVFKVAEREENNIFLPELTDSDSESSGDTEVSSSSLSS